MRVLYNTMLVSGFLLGFPLLAAVLMASRKRRKTVLQRLGVAFGPGCIRDVPSYLPSRKPVWIHALSVGEVLSAVALVDAIKERAREKSIVFSVSTFTGFEIANDRLRNRVDAIVYFPYDLIFSVKRIISRINPAVVLIVETDIWPNFLFELKQRKIPVVLVNARLSDRSLKGYLRIFFFMRSVFESFTKVCVQSPGDMDRFHSLGVLPEKTVVTGNIKFDRIDEDSADDSPKVMRQQLRIFPEQKVFLAGSTHAGEESILLEVFLRMRRLFSNLLIVVVPRDPRRARLICKQFQSSGIRAARMSELNGQHETDRFDAIVVDVIGKLQHLYSLADIAFIGGSLVNCGGHNPLEPAVYCKPILFGPDMSDFRDISEMLLAADAAIQVSDADSVYQAAVKLLEDEEMAAQMGSRAYELLFLNKGAVSKTWDVVKAYL
ncbi:MAG: 3-deoxy-D-manno-octulosonic acid transferase [Deltaproteobacteria bacterium]|nr:3-deoxy-D-manno-octulosonic acid transferase [Deltaproteobacteria bacterium]